MPLEQEPEHAGVFLLSSDTCLTGRGPGGCRFAIVRGLAAAFVSDIFIS